jgi:pyridoxal biosynthesis lyase PdxS
VKKEEAVESLERAGHTINGLYMRAWDTALHPTDHGWPSSIASAAAIPVLSAASIGQMVGSAVVQQLPSDLFDKLSNFGKPK